MLTRWNAALEWLDRPYSCFRVACTLFIVVSFDFWNDLLFALNVPIFRSEENYFFWRDQITGPGYSHRERAAKMEVSI